MKVKKNKGDYKTDPFILGTIIILLFFGLVMLSSASVVISETKFGDPYHLVKRQLILGLIPGLVLFFTTQKIKYTFWRKIAVPFFFASILLLILALIPGIGTDFKGASSWIDLGFFAFQPAEIVKLSLVVYLAAWLEGRKDKIKSLKNGLLPFLVVLGIPTFLIVSQPDIGTLSIVLFIGIIMFFVSGAPIKYMAGLFGGGLALFAILMKLKPYRMERFKVFLDSGIDPQDIGYQINQALLAIGSGGILGLGLGHSRQKFNYLPEPVGDSIFAIIAEELGFIGAVFLLSLFVFFALRSLRLAGLAPDKFSRMLVVGIVSWITFQAFVNIMGITKLIPLTGITLPFISYGSTSLVTVLMASGILLNISKYSKKTNKK